MSPHKRPCHAPPVWLKSHGLFSPSPMALAPRLAHTIEVMDQATLAPGTLVGERYRIGARLGRSASGSVYGATDRARDDLTVALKVLGADTFAAQTLHEHRALCRLDHPGCAKVHDVGRLPGVGTYLVRALVDGTALASRLAREDPKYRSGALVAAARGLLESLGYLHGHGVVHGRLTPNNVVCAADAETIFPVLLDFGLAHRRGGKNIPGDALAYRAPELFGAGACTARSDLYALGVILYELAAGVPPFSGRSVAIIRGHLSETPAPLEESAPWLEPRLCDLVSRLLAKAPGSRPHSVREAIEFIARSSGGPSPSLDAPNSGSLGSPLLVGRDEHLAMFDRALREPRGDVSVLLCFDGPMGSGRTRLLGELAVRCVLAGGWALRWTGRELVGPGADLVSAAQRRLRHADADLPELRVAMASLSRAPPVGRRVLDGISDAPDWRRRAALIIDVVRALADTGVNGLLLDDVDDGGGTACDIAMMVARAADTSGISTVAAGLPPGLTASGLDVQRARLEPLTTGELETFVLSAIGEVHDLGVETSFADWLKGASGGQPEVAKEWLHTLVASGRLTRDGDRWRLSAADDRAAGDITDQLRALTIQRLAGLSDVSLRLAAAAALFGERFDPEIITQAALLDPDILGSALAELRQHRVLSMGEGRWPLRFTFPALRAAALARAEGTLPHGVDGTRRRLANALEEALEQGGLSHSTLSATLGLQRLCLGDPAGADAILTAVSEVFSSNGYSETCALLFAAEAELAVGEQSAAVTARRAAVQVALGDLELAVGHLDRARLAFEAALDLARYRSPILRRLGQIAIAQSDLEQGLDLLEQVLEDLRADGFERFKAAYEIGAVLMRQGHLESAQQSVQLAYDICDETRDPRARARTTALKARIVFMSGEPEEAIAIATRAISAFEAVQEPRHAAEAQMQLGGALRSVGRADESAACYRAAMEVFTAERRLTLLGECQSNLAELHVFKGDLRAATALFEELRGVLQVTGQPHALISLHNNLGSLYRDRGQFQRSELLLNEGLRLARGSKHRQLEATLMGNLAELSIRQGLYDAALAQLDETERVSQVLGAHEEQLKAARRRLEIQCDQDPARIDMALHTELLATAQDDGAAAEQAPLLRLQVAHHRANRQWPEGLEAIARAGAIADKVSAVERVRLTREHALLLKATGEAARAETLLEECIGELEQMDAGWDLLVTKSRLSSLRRKHPGQRVATSSPTATTETAGDLMRFSRSLGQARDLQDYLDRVVAGVMSLVPAAERSFVIVYDDRGNPIAKSTRGGTDVRTAPDAREVVFSRTITEECMRAGKPLYVQDAMSDPRFSAARSVLALRLCTVVALPLLVGTRSIGVLYVDTRQVVHRTLEDALPLLELAATMVAAGVDRAEAVDAQRSQSEAVSMFVHELRQPLASVLAHLRVARAVVTTGQEHLARALAELQRLGRMVDNLHDYSTAHKQATRPSIVSILLVEVIESVVDNLGPLLADAGVEIKTSVPKTLPYLLGNRDQVIQVFMNLLTYAVRCSDPESAVTLRAHAVADDRSSGPVLGPVAPPARMLAPVQEHVSAIRRVEVTVAASGAGFDRSLSTIFAEPMSQSSPLSSRVGLVVARMIVERHGGDIALIESGEHAGATIRFTLPALSDGG